jgi:hypothetical protein
MSAASPARVHNTHAVRDHTARPGQTTRQPVAATFRRMPAVSNISTMNVDWSLARSSDAPTRLHVDATMRILTREELWPPQRRYYAPEQLVHDTDDGVPCRNKRAGLKDTQTEMLHARTWSRTANITLHDTSGGRDDAQRYLGQDDCQAVLAQVRALATLQKPHNEHYLRSVRCAASHTRRHATHTMLGPDTRQTSGTESPAKRRLFGVKWR